MNTGLMDNYQAKGLPNLPAMAAGPAGLNVNQTGQAAPMAAPAPRPEARPRPADGTAAPRPRARPRPADGMAAPRPSRPRARKPL